MEQSLAYVKSQAGDINGDKIDSGRQNITVNFPPAEHSQTRSNLVGGDTKIPVGTTSVPDDPDTASMFQVPYLRKLCCLKETTLLCKDFKI